MKNRIPIILFIFLMAVVFLPLGQEFLFRFETKPLNGKWNHVEKPKLQYKSFIAGEYQKEIEKYVSENYGFNEIPVRFYNELIWDFYGKTYVDYIVRGSDGWIFNKDDVKSYYGSYQHKNFKNNKQATDAYDKLTSSIYKLRGVLNDYGIGLVVFVTPNKCKLYSQYLPEWEFDTTTVRTLDYFKVRFDKFGIPYLDMTEVFKAIGDTIPFPLIGPGGGHWNFSCVYGIDSLLQFVGKETDTKIARIRCGKLEPYDKKTEKDNIADYDSEGMLNLVFPRNHKRFRLYKSDMKYISRPSCVKPSMLFVGNSFFWRPLDLIRFDSIVSNCRFWYYNNTAFCGKKAIPTSEIDYISEILQSDCIVTFCNEIQLHEMTFGFANKALVELCVPDSIMEREILNLCNRHGITREDATRWIYKNTDNIPELRGDRIPTIRNERTVLLFEAIKNIKNDRIWLDDLYKIRNYFGKTDTEIVGMEANNLVKKQPLLRDYDILMCKKQYEHMIDSIENIFKCDSADADWYFRKHSNEFTPLILSKMETDRDHQ
ncbi:MAG: hypothetical protein IKS65_01790 [Bacteroidales bacterium]|nr:hypothetical protein [Bacteroidales bacterium]